MAKREKDKRIELTGYSLLEHYEKLALEFLQKCIDREEGPVFTDLTEESKMKAKTYKAQHKIADDIDLAKTKVTLNQDEFHGLVAFSFNPTSPAMENPSLTVHGGCYLDHVRGAMYKYPEFCIGLLDHLLKRQKKIFDPRKFHEDKDLGIKDLVRFHLLTTKGNDIQDNDLAIHINEQYEYLKIAQLKARHVGNVRYGLVEEREDWLSLRNSMAEKNYCKPAPPELL